MRLDQKKTAAIDAAVADLAVTLRLLVQEATADPHNGYHRQAGQIGARVHEVLASVARYATANQEYYERRDTQSRKLTRSPKPLPSVKRLSD